MKLELKHLAPYLPHKFTFMFDGVICSLDGIDVNGDVFNADSGEIPIILIKPILRPLSDLFKSITHNEKTFTPYHKLQFDFNKGQWNKRVERIITDVDFHGLSLMPNCIMLKLYEWHFDVFGLIQEGLAIDINILK